MGAVKDAAAPVRVGVTVTSAPRDPPHRAASGNSENESLSLARIVVFEKASKGAEGTASEVAVLPRASSAMIARNGTTVPNDLAICATKMKGSRANNSGLKIEIHDLHELKIANDLAEGLSATSGPMPRALVPMKFERHGSTATRGLRVTIARHVEARLIAVRAKTSVQAGIAATRSLGKSERLGATTIALKSILAFRARATNVPTGRSREIVRLENTAVHTPMSRVKIARDATKKRLVERHGKSIREVCPAMIARDATMRMTVRFLQNALRSGGVALIENAKRIWTSARCVIPR